MSHPSISGSTMVVYLPSLGELTGIRQLGAMTAERLTSVSVCAAELVCACDCVLVARALTCAWRAV